MNELVVQAEDEGQEIPIVQPTPEVINYLPVIEGPQTRVFCSLPRTSAIDRARVAMLMTAQLPALVDQVNKTILVEHAIITTIEKTDKETGEVITLPYVVLVDNNGRGYKTSGTVPCNSLRRLCQSMGNPPWAPPIPLKVEPWSRNDSEKSVILQLDFEAFCLLAEQHAKKQPKHK